MQNRHLKFNASNSLISSSFPKVFLISMGYSFFLRVTQKRKPVLMRDIYRRQTLEIPELLFSIFGNQDIRYGFLSMSCPPVMKKNRWNYVNSCYAILVSESTQRDEYAFNTNEISYFCHLKLFKPADMESTNTKG